MSHAEQQPDAPTQPEALRTIQSDDLLQGQREVFILHNGETYKLRLTKSGKLILNK